MSFPSSWANWAKYKSLKPNSDGVVKGVQETVLGELEQKLQEG